MAVLDLFIMAVGAFALSAVFRILTSNPNAASSLWLANGFALGMLLSSPRQRWPLLLAVTGVAEAASAFYLGSARNIVVWLALFNVLEALVAATLLAGAIRAAADLTSRPQLPAFSAVRRVDRASGAGRGAWPGSIL